jgi:hypothetical protein
MRAAILATLLVSLCACGDDDERPAECTEISEACHELDSGSGPAHDCHEGAHDAWSREECVAMRASCLAACGAE